MSEACNFNLMYTAMEVAVEQSSIFTSLCRQGTEIFHDNVEKVFSDFVYHYCRTEGIFELKPQNGRQKYFLRNRSCIARGGSERYFNLKLESKKKIPRQELRLQDFCAQASSEKQVDCWLIRARISPESA